MPFGPTCLQDVATGVWNEEVRRVLGKHLVRISRVIGVGSGMSRIEHRGGGRCLVPNLEPDGGTALRIGAAQANGLSVAMLNYPEHFPVIAVLADRCVALGEEERLRARLD